MSKILVTGAAGFIGSHLTEALLKRGHTVIGVDNFETGNRANLHCPNIERDIATWQTTTQYAPVDSRDVEVIFHLAGLADIVPSIDDPYRYHAVNVHGTLRLLEWARVSGTCRRFIYAASSSCYGIPTELPTPETARIQCNYPYALTKHLGEQYVNHYARVYGMSTASLRLANVFGPRSRTSGAYGALFGTLMAQIANDAPVTIVGDGKQRRDFIWISDVVDAFIACAESSAVGAFNIGSGASHSVNAVAEGLGARERESLPWRAGEPNETRLDSSKAILSFKWAPQVAFADGLAEMRALIPEFKSAPLWTPGSIAVATAGWNKYLGGS